MILVILTAWIAISLVFLFNLAVVARHSSHETALAEHDAHALDQLPVLVTLNQKSAPVST
jgi:hypothetical protein